MHAWCIFGRVNVCGFFEARCHSVAMAQVELSETRLFTTIGQILEKTLFGGVLRSVNEDRLNEMLQAYTKEGINGFFLYTTMEVLIASKTFEEAPEVIVVDGNRRCVMLMKMEEINKGTLVNVIVRQINVEDFASIKEKAHPLNPSIIGRELAGCANQRVAEYLLGLYVKSRELRETSLLYKNAKYMRFFAFTHFAKDLGTVPWKAAEQYVDDECREKKRDKDRLMLLSFFAGSATEQATFELAVAKIKRPMPAHRKIFTRLFVYSRIKQLDAAVASVIRKAKNSEKIFTAAVWREELRKLKEQKAALVTEKVKKE